MLRSSFVEETANPWSPSSTYINVGSLQNILTFAEKSGHIDRRNVNMEEIRRKVDTSSPSVALIRLLREITRLGKALDKVTICQRSSIADADEECDMAAVRGLSTSDAMFKSVINNMLKDFPHVECLHEDQRDCIENMVNGSRCHQLEQISGQLSTIIEKKDELISRLQQPFVGEFLEIDAAHHKNTAEILPMISSDLASFPTVLENIAWIRNFSLADGQLVCEFISFLMLLEM
ncbi:uncharacterized protein LOC110061667 [Orbicella faveolata]|uniref:uncharacterized protein LOC110061667 n=1 Tax=Orbicella faveolata TaxID=48498 RepID=UPI0009E34A5F|nr:uncharacterized protein LOC110061667 [Orbicella faveolata]